MGYRRDDRTETFEGKIEHKAPKSYIVEFTLGGRYFVPISQITNLDDVLTNVDEDGNRVFEVTQWWWDKRHDFGAT
jgi:hypothetical protein